MTFHQIIKCGYYFLGTKLIRSTSNIYFFLPSFWSEKFNTLAWYFIVAWKVTLNMIFSSSSCHHHHQPDLTNYIQFLLTFFWRTELLDSRQSQLKAIPTQSNPNSRQSQLKVLPTQSHHQLKLTLITSLLETDEYLSHLQQSLTY